MLSRCSGCFIVSLAALLFACGDDAATSGSAGSTTAGAGAGTTSTGGAGGATTTSTSSVGGGPGERIAYVGVTVDGEGVLSAALDGSDAQVVSVEDPASFSFRSLAWSPNGQHLVYVTLRKSDHQEALRVVDADGENPRVLIPEGVADDIDAPSWSPDGTTILFQARRLQTHIDIFSVSATGGDPEPFIVSDDSEGGPAWSPDGSAVVYQRATDLWRATADGSDQKLLFDGLSAEGEAHPTWSPDGERILFSAGPFGETDLYSIRSDGTDLQPLTELEGVEVHPSLSQDGSLLAFTHVPPAKPGSIQVLDTVTSNLSELVTLAGHPAYQP